jgi:hypothetical protein
MTKFVVHLINPVKRFYPYTERSVFLPGIPRLFHCAIGVANSYGRPPIPFCAAKPQCRTTTGRIAAPVAPLAVTGKIARLCKTAPAIRSNANSNNP